MSSHNPESVRNLVEQYLTGEGRVELDTPTIVNTERFKKYIFYGITDQIDERLFSQLRRRGALYSVQGSSRGATLSISFPHKLDPVYSCYQLFLVLVLLCVIALLFLHHAELFTVRNWIGQLYSA